MSWDRITTSLAYISGAEGPLHSVFDWLRSHGLGERVIKSAVASVLAWEIASLLPGNPSPVLAPLTAVFSINLTIAGGMRDAAQRILGVVLGIALALLINEIVGPTGLAIGLVVLVSFFIGRRLGLEAGGVQQLAVTALLIVLGAAGTQVNNIAALHLANTLIGTGIGLVLNASVAPPNYLPGARQQLLQLGNALHATVLGLSASLSAGITQEAALAHLLKTRELASSLHTIDSALGKAEESLRYNLFGRSQGDVLVAYRAADLALEHTAIQIRIIARSLNDATQLAKPPHSRPDWLEPDALGTPVANLLNVCAVALQGFMLPIDDPSSPARVPVSARLAIEQLRAVSETAERYHDDLGTGGWIYLGECIAVSLQLIYDLSAASVAWLQPGNPVVPAG